MNLPLFSNLAMSDVAENVSHNEHTTAPMVEILKALQKSMSSHAAPTCLKYFCKQHENDSHLEVNGLWDDNMKLCVVFELEFFSKHRNKFFIDASYRRIVRTIFSPGRDQQHSPCLMMMSKRARGNYSLRSLEKCATATPSQGLRPYI